MIARASIARLLSRLLSTFLHVDSHDIDGQLLQGDPGISFHNVKIREREIPLSMDPDNHHRICKLILGGTVEELTLSWTWSARKLRLLENSQLTIKGLHLNLQYIYSDKDPNDSSRPTTTRSHSEVFRSKAEEEEEEEEEEKEPESPKGKTVFSNYLKEELIRLRKAVINNLRESQFVKQAIQDVIDSFNIQIDKVLLDMQVPLTGQTIVIGLETLRFDSLLAQMNRCLSCQSSNNTATKSSPVMMNLEIGGLYAHLKDRFHWTPILEPFTYRTHGRRFHGTRFIDWKNGYEVIGNSRTNNGMKNGIVLHHTDPTWAAIQAIQKAWCGKPIAEPDYDKEIYQSAPVARGKTPWPVSAKILLWFSCQIVIGQLMLGWGLALTWLQYLAQKAYLALATTTWLQQLQNNLPNRMITLALIWSEYLFQKASLLQGNYITDWTLWILGGILSILSTVYIIRWELNPTEEQTQKNQAAATEANNRKKHIDQQPATFRLPVPFITLHAPEDIQLDLTNISVVGNVDRNSIYAFAEGFDVVSRNYANPGPKVYVSGIRASYIHRRLLVNIDLIDSLFIPNQFRLAKPLECSVIRFEEGRMTIKLRSLKGWLLSEGDDNIEPRLSTFADVSVGEGDFSLNFKSFAAKMNKSRLKKQTEIAAQKAIEKTGKVIDKTGKVVKNTGGIMVKKTGEMVNGQVKVMNEQRKVMDKKVVELRTGMMNNGMPRIRNVRLSVLVPSKRTVEQTPPLEVAARNRMKAEIYEYLIKLQRIAAIFEKVPCQNNRQNLRMYQNSFRGSEGVDFLLENNMAETREEAIKFLKDFEIEFNLFHSVTREYKFHDNYNCLYRFVDPSQRRQWKKDDIPYGDYVEDFDREPVPSWLPFPISVFADTVVLQRQAKAGEDEDEVFSAKIRKARIFLENGHLSRSIEFTFFAGLMKTYFMALTNGRLHGIIHPDVPKLIHRLQFSVDQFLVNPELSVEDWLEQLGFVADIDSENESDDDDHEPGESFSSIRKPYSLPYALIPEFALILSYSGPLMKAKDSLIRIDAFQGNAKTNSNDLILMFVSNIFERSASVLTHLRFLGVSPVQSAGIGVTMNVGAKVIPMGQYIVIGALAIYDGVCMTIDLGKVSRHDPTGRHHSGDFFRGLWAMGGETARYGAQARGKTDEEFYDENDQIKLDAMDFVVGATRGMGSYANKNKAKFAGAYVAAAVMIGTTVAFGPLGGIVAGVIAGAGTEAAVRKIERRFGKDKEEERVGDNIHDDIDDIDDRNKKD